jgi:transcriptional/translational regulatory protein YebC/TACO1
MFEQVGIVAIAAPTDEEAFLEVLLEAGADNYQLIDLEEETIAEVVTSVLNLEALSQALQRSGYQVREAEPRWLAGNTVEITELEQAKRILKLMDALEDLDDVQAVSANFEIADPAIAEMIA